MKKQGPHLPTQKCNALITRLETYSEKIKGMQGSGREAMTALREKSTKKRESASRRRIRAKEEVTSTGREILWIPTEETIGGNGPRPTI